MTLPALRSATSAALRRSTLSRTQTAAARFQVRRSAGGQPESQSMQAVLFGGKSYEGWEAIVYPTYAIATVILVVGLGFKPDTHIQTWAKNEARTRMALRDSGAVTDFEFGVHYDDPSRKFSFVINQNVDAEEGEDGVEMMPVANVNDDPRLGKKKFW
eukprot:CAMPEP_0194345182 /NCGR_PEP_ID=MMETSP0171-20130528/104712_1 /TAXON_ID=218684 /ORGANISM="Corethron pennatum, Strain L29A3" /LENGTH=157 /DNA_ID=CAMNT_0039112135 /DNA_START=82 /DNA_END=555 /DNA_ORIENTATION=+